MSGPLHGGDTEGFALKYGVRPLDFSASLNPLGMPAEVARAARDAVDGAGPYPDPLCRRLTRALAQRLAVDEERVFFGAGAADVIFRIAAAARPDRALLVAPCFAEYERALVAAGCGVVWHCLREDADFAPDEGVAAAVRPGIRMCFWCEPANPTGRLGGRDFLHALLRRCEDVGAVLVVDECFGDFVEEGERYSMLPQVAAHPNLVVLGSFTKLYAMAGIRLGYAVCGDALPAPRLRQSGQPWAVSHVAQQAGVAALAQSAYAAESLAYIREQKALLRAGLEGLGMRVSGSRANYIFFRSPEPRLHERLAEQGILIRSCENFKGLGPGYYRVAVRTRDENARLLRAMAYEDVKA